MTKKMTREQYDAALERIAKAVFESFKPLFPEGESTDYRDLWGNVACQIAEDAIDEVCGHNDIDLPDLTLLSQEEEAEQAGRTALEPNKLYMPLLCHELRTQDPSATTQMLIEIARLLWPTTSEADEDHMDPLALEIAYVFIKRALSPLNIHERTL